MNIQNVAQTNARITDIRGMINRVAEGADGRRLFTNRVRKETVSFVHDTGLKVSEVSLLLGLKNNMIHKWVRTNKSTPYSLDDGASMRRVSKPTGMDAILDKRRKAVLELAKAQENVDKIDKVIQMIQDL